MATHKYTKDNKIITIEIFRACGEIWVARQTGTHLSTSIIAKNPDRCQLEQKLKELGYIYTIGCC